MPWEEDLATTGFGRRQNKVLYPSPEAIRQVHNLFSALSDYEGFLNKAEIGTDRTGDLRIEWRTKEKVLEFVFPKKPTTPSYIFFNEGEYYDVIEGCIEPAIADKWVRWFLGRGRRPALKSREE